MKVLFVASGNEHRKISPIVENQLNSLSCEEIDLVVFPVMGRGLLSYLRAISMLRRHLSKSKYEVVHAHYSLSGFVAALSGAKRLVVSLMGSDVKDKWSSKRILKFFIRNYWTRVIVKSKEMSDILDETNVVIIPNGVDLNRFIPNSDKVASKKRLDLDVGTKYVLFGANPARPEKNYKLAKESFEKLSEDNLELITLHNIPNSQIADYLNSSEVVILTSLREGSPNIIKEAMACNRPIVCTNVGDVKWLLEGVDGCYLAKSNDIDYKEKISQAMKFSEQNNATKGRERIQELGLDSQSIAQRIRTVYNNI